MTMKVYRNIDSNPGHILKLSLITLSLPSLRTFDTSGKDGRIPQMLQLSGSIQVSEKLCVGDVVVLKVVTSQWPLARIVETSAGADGLVHVVTLLQKSHYCYHASTNCET